MIVDMERMLITETTQRKFKIACKRNEDGENENPVAFDNTPQQCGKYGCACKSMENARRTDMPICQGCNLRAFETFECMKEWMLEDIQYYINNSKDKTVGKEARLHDLTKAQAWLQILRLYGFIDKDEKDIISGELTSCEIRVTIYG